MKLNFTEVMRRRKIFSPAIFTVSHSELHYSSLSSKNERYVYIYNSKHYLFVSYSFWFHHFYETLFKFFCLAERCENLNYSS